MMDNALADSLVVVNGPSDGTAHALIRTRVSIGADRNCDIVLINDEDVRERHAEIFATGRGFRVRCFPGGVMRINGKRTGRIGSRLLRDGDIVEFGNTELMVHRIDGGHVGAIDGEAEASRSKRGYVRRSVEAVALTISALWYAVSDALHVVAAVTARMIGALMERRRLVMRLTIVACAIAAYAFLPGIRRVVDAALHAAAEYFNFAAESISQLTGR